MTAWLVQNFAPVMFGGLVFFLLSGFPVAFALSACGLFFAFIGIELGMLPNALMQAIPLRLMGVVQNETLLAIPFFTFMGLVLERSGMAEDLLDTIGQLFGSMRGGLAIAVIVVGALLAATTGIVAASVISMGLISLPIMLRHNYDRYLASGVITAAGTLAQIIPPSLVLIVLADQLGRSVGDMFAAAIVPSLMLTGLYLVYVIGLTIFRPKLMPALPLEARNYREPNGNSGLKSLFMLALASTMFAMTFAKYHVEVLRWIGVAVEAVTLSELIPVSICTGILFASAIALLNKALGLGMLSEIAQRVCFVLIPPLLLIFIVLGTIFTGVATPTEAGALGALGTVGMAAVRGKLSTSMFKQALSATTKLSCFVMFIVFGATIFSLTFQGVDGPDWVKSLLSELPGGQLGFLIAVNILVFVLALFLDFFELSFIVVPLLAPVAESLGIDLVWFGVLLAINMQTSFLTPPFGFALFFLRSVAPASPYQDRVTKKTVAPVKTGQIYWGALPFVILQLVMVGLIIGYPDLVSRSPAQELDLNPELYDALRLDSSGSVGGANAATFQIGSEQLDDLFR